MGAGPRLAPSQVILLRLQRARASFVAVVRAPIVLAHARDACRRNLDRWAQITLRAFPLSPNAHIRSFCSLCSTLSHLEHTRTASITCNYLCGCVFVFVFVLLRHVLAARLFLDAAACTLRAKCVQSRDARHCSVRTELRTRQHPSSTKAYHFVCARRELRDARQNWRKQTSNWNSPR